MKFITLDTADNLDLIRKILADCGLDGFQNITRLQSGSRSVAYYADDYVVRFPKAEVVWQNMQREKAAIDVLYPHLMPYFEKKIHKIELVDGVYPFSVSKRFLGKICDGREESEYATLYQNLKPAQQCALARDLAMFFYLMHKVDYMRLNIPLQNETVDNWDVTQRNNFDYAAVREILLLHGIDLDDYKVEAPNVEKALCHNDLSGSNLIINPENDNVLVGIIDFGNATVMPKFLDFLPLYKISRQLAVDTLAEYNKLSVSKIDQRQADFSALCYIGYGLKHSINENSAYFMKLLKMFL